jgi:hypothetical protein
MITLSFQKLLCGEFIGGKSAKGRQTPAREKKKRSQEEEQNKESKSQRGIEDRVIKEFIFGYLHLVSLN